MACGGPARFRLEMGRELVGDGEIGIQLEGTTEGRLRPDPVPFRVFDVLADQAVSPAQPRPGGREGRVFVEGLQVEVSGHRHLLVAEARVVATQVELVGPRALGGERCGSRSPGAALQRQGQRTPRCGVLSSSCSRKTSPTAASTVWRRAACPRAPPRAGRWPAASSPSAAGFRAARDPRRPPRRCACRSGCSSAAKRAASVLERTTTELPTPASDVLTASARPREKKSVSGSGAQHAERQHHEPGDGAGSAVRLGVPGSRAMPCRSSAMASAEAGDPPASSGGRVRMTRSGPAQRASR